MNLLRRVQERRNGLWAEWEGESTKSLPIGPPRALWGNLRATWQDSALLRGVFWCFAGYAGLVVVIVLAVQGCEAKAAGHPQMTQMDADKQEKIVGGCGGGLGGYALTETGKAVEKVSAGTVEDDPKGRRTPLQVCGEPGGESGQSPIILQALAPAERTAIETVESGGDPKAWKKDEDARGIIQIRPIYVADANRILGVERFKHDDAFDPVKAWQMFEVVTSHYIRAYGYADTFETRARIHNGGDKGPTRKSTLKYWRRVREEMERDRGWEPKGL